MKVFAKTLLKNCKKYPFQRLLEVGPGGGALTKYLLKIPAVDFKAVELDDEKVVFLEKAYPANKGIALLMKVFLILSHRLKMNLQLLEIFPTTFQHKSCLKF